MTGIPFLDIGLVADKRSKRSQAWPMARGEVLSSTVVENTGGDSESTSTSYQPVFEYQYTIMGQRYSSKRIGYGPNSYNYQKAQVIAAQYPVGAEVAVHYKPEKVTERTLETTARGGKLFSILGYILVPLEILLVILGLFTI
jgi:hypothetical protein